MNEMTRDIETTKTFLRGWRLTFYFGRLYDKFLSRLDGKRVVDLEDASAGGVAVSLTICSTFEKNILFCVLSILVFCRYLHQ